MAESKDKPSAELAELAKLQGARDELTAQIRALQAKLRERADRAAAEAHLDSLPPGDRGVLIEAAAARMGAKPGKAGS